MLLNHVLFPSVFRELLQNSDDAGSLTAEVHFETAAGRDRRDRKEKSLPDLKSTSVLALGPSHAYPVLLITLSKVIRWMFRNNGKPFAEQDWTRLRTIGVSIIILFPHSPPYLSSLVS